MRVLMIDNYDSFTYNLVQYLGELGADVHVVRNDRAGVDEMLGQGYARCVISPGPCTPDEAGISLEAARRLPEAGIPTLGVCLGHQALGQTFGARVELHPPVHGKATTIEHDGRTIFSGLSSPLRVGRYHSLVVSPELPDCLEESARGGGVLMGLRHRELPAEGVQFHPESVLTDEGKLLLRNFLDGRVAGSEPDPAGAASDLGGAASDPSGAASDLGGAASDPRGAASDLAGAATDPSGAGAAGAARDA